MTAAGPVALIAALHSEYRLARRAGAGSAVCSAYLAGPGPVAAGAAANRAIADGAAALVSWGLAGGLIPEARTGTVVVPQRVLQTDGASFDAAVSVRDWLLTCLPDDAFVLTGDLVSADAAVTTPAAKRQLALQLGAVAVDMESAAIARSASLADVPFVALRVVADGPGTQLPAEVDRFVTSGGRSRPLRVAASLLTGRVGLSALRELQRCSGLAHRVLAAVADRLANSRPPLFDTAP